MLKTTYSLQDPSQKYQKIKNNIKKLNGEDEAMLVYQDQSDDDKQLDQAMDSHDDESNESEADEEITEMDILNKRQRLESDEESYGDEEMEGLDDSVDEQQPAKKKKSKKKAQAEEMGSSSEEDEMELR